MQRPNHTLGRELQQSLNDDKAKKQFEAAQTQLEAAFDATPRRDLSVKLVRTLVLNSDALGREDQISRFLDV